WVPARLLALREDRVELHAHMQVRIRLDDRGVRTPVVIGVRSIDDAEGAIVLDLLLQDRNDVGSHPIAEAREIVSGSRGRDGDRVWELPHRLRQAVPLRLILRLMKLVKECAVHSFAVARYARQRPELCILARLLDSLHFWDQAERTLQFWLPFDDRL